MALLRLSTLPATMTMLAPFAASCLPTLKPYPNEPPVIRMVCILQVNQTCTFSKSHCKVSIPFRPRENGSWRKLAPYLVSHWIEREVKVGLNVSIAGEKKCSVGTHMDNCNWVQIFR